jgi:outer membrane protein TolC
MNSLLWKIQKAFLIMVTAGSLTICSCNPFETNHSKKVIESKTITEPQPVPEPDSAPASAQPVHTENKTEYDGPLQISITDALLMAMENNRSLMVQRYAPEVQRTFEQEDLAIFDPDLTASISQSRDKTNSIPRPGLGSFSSVTRDMTADVTLSQFFATGTALSLTGSTDVLKGSFLNEPFATSRLGLSATQSLLRGFGPAVNLATVNQARIDTGISQYELRGFAETLAAQTEETYWNYSLAEKKIQIYEQSLQLAERQQKETEDRIKIGKLAQSELAAAKAEVALRKEDLINARSNLVKTRLNLLQLLNPPGKNIWNKTIIIQTPPVSPDVQMDSVEPHLQLAMQMRPELNQAKLLLQRDELELVKTKNGLLPKLDLFATIGNTGYSNSFGRSAEEIGGHNYDILMGINLELPPVNRAARALNTRAIYTRNQAREAIKNLTELIEVDIRSAYEEILRTQEQVKATAATRILEEEKLNVETEKYKVGNSTSLLVAQAQRDLLSSQIDEVSAVVQYLNAFVELYRLEGSLLERRGIASPGREPVKLDDML